MSANANPANRTAEPLKWLLPALGSAVLPMAGFCFVLFGVAWTVQPSWVPLTISVVPLAAGLLLLLPAAQFEKTYRRAFWAVALHTALMGAMIEMEWWPFVAGASVLVDLMLLLALRGQPTGPKRFAKSTIFWVAAQFGFGIPLTALHATVVVRQAEAVAGERPYCIEYASQDDGFQHKPARTLLHLSPYYMLSRLTSNGNGVVYFHFQQHGMLVIDDGPNREYLNWSYVQESFVNETAALYTVEPVCNPERHFARRLPLFSNAH
jgi:hypothetical protein